MRQVLETLKLELGLIKFHTVEVTFPEYDVREERAAIDPKVLNDTPTCSLKHVPLQASVQILSHVIETSSVKVRDQTLKAREPSTEKICFDQDSVQALATSLRIEPTLTRITTNFNLSTTKVFFKTRVCSRNVPLLRTVRFKPSIMNEEEKKDVLRTLQTFLSQEKISSFTFIGFYRNVPIDSAKKTIVLDRELVIELRENAKGTKKNLVVLLTDEGYIFLSVPSKRSS